MRKILNIPKISHSTVKVNFLSVERVSPLMLDFYLNYCTEHTDIFETSLPAVQCSRTLNTAFWLCCIFLCILYTVFVHYSYH
jgi:hypothetical protein